MIQSVCRPFSRVSGEGPPSPPPSPVFFRLLERPQHKENKKADPLTLMTMCFKEVGSVSSARPIMDSLVVGMNKVYINTSLSLSKIG